MCNGNWSFIHDAQAQAAVLFEVAELELRPSWLDAQANLDRELTAVPQSQPRELLPSSDAAVRAEDSALSQFPGRRK